ncbi:MAG: hypothetical protein AB2385_03540 [Symbiobacterium sp.]|uniref:hypothetical protein n=1 Tax=Symbiobacterium sp. TaxID=1971213 RepID=UPI003463B6CB
MNMRRGEEPSARTIQLLVSYAIRYPEIAAVRYDPVHQALRLSFLVKGPLEDDEFAAAEARIRESLEVYHLIHQRVATLVEVTRSTFGELSTVVVGRDVQSLTPEELYAVVEVVRNVFANRVLAEPLEYFGEEELMAQDELIEEVMASVSGRRQPPNLIAIRENGRLLIFEK